MGITRMVTTIRTLIIGRTRTMAITGVHSIGTADTDITTATIVTIITITRTKVR